jgi:rhodanese-related sulfurtransferase
MAPPLAGSLGVNIWQFLLFDGAGSFVYSTCFVLLGYVFSDQLEKVLAVSQRFGLGAVVLAGIICALYLGWKWYQRRKALRHIHIARVTPEELRKKQEASEQLLIIDVRARGDVEADGNLIQGAVHMELDELEDRHAEIPRDRDIFLYCSCPNEETAGKVALFFQQRGIKRARPLAGGIEAWRAHNYPIDPVTKAPSVPWMPAM